jgi:CBS domain-containing protein
MKVEELMTAPVHVCRAEDPLELAARLLWEHDCGALPVVDGEGTVKAVVTDRDICMSAYTRGQGLGGLRVADCMSAAATTCRSGDDVAEAARAMCLAGLRRLPVVDRSGRIVGILTLGDLARASAAGGAAGKRAAQEALTVLAAVTQPRCAAPGSEPARGPARKRKPLRTAEIQAQPAGRSKKRPVTKRPRRKAGRS